MGLLAIELWAWFVDVINSPSEEMVTATEYCLVSIKCIARLNDKVIST